MSHATIQEAMVAILADMPAVGKNQRAPQQMGGYAFRGIDDVLNALNPLLAKHGVFFTPRVLERIDGQFTNQKGGITWTVRLLVEYMFRHAGEDRAEEPVIALVWGEAHDSGDKATQKALTAAQKSMLFQVFAINTADQADSDSERHEQEEAMPERPVYMSALNTKRFLDKCGEFGLMANEIDEIVSWATAGRTSDPNLVLADEVTVLRAAFESWANERAQQVASSANSQSATSSPEVGSKPGKSVPKRPLPQTDGIEDVKPSDALL